MHKIDRRVADAGYLSSRTVMTKVAGVEKPVARFALDDIQLGIYFRWFAYSGTTVAEDSHLAESLQIPNGFVLEATVHWLDARSGLSDHRDRMVGIALVQLVDWLEQINSNQWKGTAWHPVFKGVLQRGGQTMEEVRFVQTNRLIQAIWGL